jgi:hypothetical protein
MVYSYRQSMFVIDLRVKNIFDTKVHVWVQASVWLAASPQRIAYCDGLKLARRETGTD